MIKQVFSDLTPQARFRKIGAIVLYLFFLLWIIYSNNRKMGRQVDPQQNNVVVSSHQ